jgi:DNA polymerase I-like protein with 3'-5' exonuclease and polymerase domains
MSLTIDLGTASVPFELWRPGLRLSGTLIAVDTETERIESPDRVPRIVLATATDGQAGFFIARQHLSAFFEAHPAAVFVFHNAAFDLAVLDAVRFDASSLVESGRIYDTGLLYRLLSLADTGSCHGHWSLDYCCEKLLGLALPKEVLSPDGQDVRTTFGRFLRPDGLPDYAQMLQPQFRSYLEYAAKDPVATWLLAGTLNAWARRLFSAADLNIFDPAAYAAVGDHSGVDLSPSWRSHGFLTHHIQLKAAIGLAAMEHLGLVVDAARLKPVLESVQARLQAVEARLRAQYRWAPGAGSQTRLEEILKEEERCSGERLPRTETGAYARSAEALEEYRGRSEFIRLFLEREELNKLGATFLNRLDRAAGKIHGRFNVLVNTGRTSCRSGDDAGLNLQNLPCGDGVRECLCPAPGHLLLSIDYGGIELVALAQQMLTQGGQSAMAEAIRRGADLHALYAAHRDGHDIHALLRWDKTSLMALLGLDADKKRKRSKPVNFGYPGGLGAKTFVTYAKAAYGVDLTEEEARAEKEHWLNCWPEMRQHLASDDLSTLAQRFSHLWATHPKARGPFASGDLPWPVHVFRGIICGNKETATSKRPYTAEEIVWACNAAAAVLAGSPHLSDDERRAAETRLRERLFGRDLWLLLTPRVRFTATLTGRLRGYPSYCAARNNVFQGLAADGAKLALYRLHREKYRVVNFIHDEFLIELPEAANHAVEAKKIERILVEEMNRVVPDLPVLCEYALMRRWYAAAEALFDYDGLCLPLTQWQREGLTDEALLAAKARLVPWEPQA